MNNTLANSDSVNVEGDETDWMARHLMLNVPDWLDEKRQPFAYNEIYGFWRSNYVGQQRRAIRDYEKLREHLPLPARHSLAISGMHLYIRSVDDERHTPCTYERLSRAVPMDSPVEPEVIWDMITAHSKTSFIGCSFGHVAKSHVLRSKNADGLTSVRAMLDKELGPQGYETSMFIRATSGGPELMVSITHASESFDDLIEAVALDGFYPCDGESCITEQTAPLTLDDELALQEASLLKQLEAVRAQRRALSEEDPHLGEM